MENETGIVVIFCTASPENAAAMARELVNRHLAACVNVFPVTSIYRWEGEICCDAEHLMIVKTAKMRAAETVAAIRSMHTAELPEIIVLPVTGGYTPYIGWVQQESRPAGK